MKLFEIMAVGSGIPTDRVFGQDHTWNIFWYDKEKRWVLVDTLACGAHDTVEVLCLRKGKKVTLFVYNHNTPGGDIKEEEVQNSVQGDIREMKYAVIDENHTNPRRAWREMGSPAYLKRDAVNALKETAKLQYANRDVKADENGCSLSFVTQKESVSIFKIVQR